MRTTIDVGLRSGLLVAILTAASACSKSENAVLAPPTDPSSFGTTVSGYGDWNGALADTTPLPPTPLDQTVLTSSNGDNWVCQNTQLDDRRNLDALLSPGSTAGVLWPGALIQGQSLIDGVPAEIPLPRSPITISIDLAVDSAAIRIADPTSASVQVAIATLQREADSRLGPIDVVPARINFTQTEANSSRQANLDLGISLSASGKVEGVNASASIGFDISTSKSYQAHTIAVTLVQPMYTISFADEEKTEPGDYLAASVTDAQVQDVLGRGLISSTNLPTYVKSVTYGRMLVFTMTNTTQASAQDIEAALEASVSKFKLGGSTSDHLATQDSTILQNSNLQVQAFGGSQDSALAAIRSGDLSKFFTAVPATQAVPLSYRVNYLKNGHVALLGAEVTDTSSNCAPAGTTSRYWFVKLDSVTSNGSCPLTYSDSAYVFAGADSAHPAQGNAYVLLALASAPLNDTTVGKEIVLPIGPTTGLAVWSAFKDASCPIGGLSCQALRLFSGGDTLAANPYTFTQYISMTGQEAGCVASFFWEVRTGPVLSPPARVRSAYRGSAARPTTTG